MLILFSQNSVLVPDYSKPLKIVGETSSNNNTGLHFLSGQQGIGGWASKESHYYLKTSYRDSAGNYLHRFAPNENMSYIVPSSGYLSIELSYAPWYRSALTYEDTPIYFWVALVRDGHEYDIASLYVASTALDTAKGSNGQVPVRKGDKIYWGGLWETIDTSDQHRNICEYSIMFYPALSITAGSE